MQGVQGTQGLQGAQGNQGLQGAGTGGSGTYDIGISTSIYVSVTSGIGTNTSVTNDIFSGPGIAYSFPSSTSYDYVLESIHITNKSANNLYFTARHDLFVSSNNWNKLPISNRVIIPYQGSLELLDQPRIANSSDILRFQALTGVGTAESGVDGGLDAFITYSRKTDLTYVGIGTTITKTDQEIYTSTGNPSMVQSIGLANYNLNIDADVTVSVFRGGTVGNIAATGVRLGYLAYNLTVPKNSVVELCQKPKYLAKGDSILVSSTPFNSVGILVSARTITSPTL